jgi:predicted MFS family arabinose efflux permease
MALLTGLGIFAFSAVFAVFVLYAVGPDSVMHLTEPQYGVLLTAFAVGAFAGALVAERVERWIGRARTLLAMVLATSTQLLVPALTANPWIIGASAALLGRANNVYRLVAWGTMPLGALFGGQFAEAWGVETVFVVGAAVSLSPLMLFGILTDRAMLGAEQVGD